MTEPAPPTHEEIQESKRLRLAGFWLALGFVLLASSYAVYYVQLHGDAQTSNDGKRAGRPVEDPTAVDERPIGAVTDPAARSRLLRLSIIYGFVLFLVFLLAAYVLSRWSRAFRFALFRKAPPDTPTTDVWKMHHVPPIEEDDS